MRVLIRPPHSRLLNNQLFADEVIAKQHWYAPLRDLREQARKQSVEIDTWDIHPLDTADVLYFIDLPTDRATVRSAQHEAPQAAFVVQLWESPFGRPHFYQRENYEGFDAVLTYNPKHCNEERFFRYFIPLGHNEAIDARMSFEERQPLILINTNRRPGIFGVRQPGLVGIPGLRRLTWIFSDWSVSVADALFLSRGELYSRRRKIARHAERAFPDLLDIYGRRWQGEPTGWANKLVPNRPFANAKGPFEGSKLNLLTQYRFCLAFENMTGDVGYITEKLFDCLFAGTVPIYLGDQSIQDHVWPECFVDARRFGSDEALLRYVRDCPKHEWNAYLEAGQAYLQSQDVEEFHSESFCRQALAAITHASRRSDKQQEQDAGTGDSWPEPQHSRRAR